MKPIGVLVNPAANRGRGNQVGEQVFSQLAKAGIPAINLSAESAIAAAKKAQVAISDQEISGVIAVGGDGTTQLGVNICVPNQIPLGIVPAGSGKPAMTMKVRYAGPIPAPIKAGDHIADLVVTTANTPPKPCRPSQLKDKNKSVLDCGRFRGSSSVMLALWCGPPCLFMAHCHLLARPTGPGHSRSTAPPIQQPDSGAGQNAK